MRGTSLGVFLMLLVATAAWAQTGKHVSLGGAIDVTSYSDKEFSVKNPGFAVAYRFNLKPDQQAPDGWRWAPKVGVGWSSREITGDIGSTRTVLGKLQSLPIELGVQRVLRQGPWHLGIGVAAGPSFNSLKVNQAARDAYASQFGAELGDIEVKTSLAVGPDVSAWYDLNDWFALHGSVSYLFNRPKVETLSQGVTTSSTWKTDHATASIGLVVGIF
jgi:hypothetical protein